MGIVQSLQTAVNVVAPMFLMLALGCLLRMGGLLDRETLERLNNVCFKVFLSLLLYYNIYTADVADIFNPRLLGFALLLQAAVWGLLFLTVPRFEKSNKRRGAMIQGIGRTNFVIFGTAIGTALCGEGNIGPISLLVAAVVPFYNVLAVIALEIFRGGRVRPLTLARSVAANPYIVAAAAALVTLLLGVRLPEFVESAVRDLTRCATPLTLIVLGGLFNFGAVRGNLRQIAAAVVCRLVVVPALALPVCIWAGFRGVELVGLVSMLIAPTAASSFNMAQSMDSDADLAGHLVVFTSLFSVLTMFLWIFGLGAAGYIF
ncbi:AEC family transporter [Anaerotruncus sp.]|uniref:AEC family transporter n=1 Tax=Anaerotruncus sp. TaxID=1872531 RepID=UPI0025BDCDB1|nr:AEC family transporter [Anaerotruncus sp.]